MNTRLIKWERSLIALFLVIAISVAGNARAQQSELYLADNFHPKTSTVPAFTDTVAQANEAGADTSTLGTNDCHCFGVVSWKNLSGASHRDAVCLDLGDLHTYGTLINCSGNADNRADCCHRVSMAAAALSAAQLQQIAKCACDAGAPNGTVIAAYCAVGTANYDQAQTLGTLVSTPAVTNCKCPPGWLSNSMTPGVGTQNIDGGATDTKYTACKKAVCGPLSIKPYPANSTQIGTWGFTWADEIWAYGSQANGGAAICTTTPGTCKLNH